jgi:putative endonuclease
MSIFSRLIFQGVHWRARRGLREDESALPGGPDETHEAKEKARRVGIRGETYGYWYLRRHGYVFVARNYMPRGVKGELDLVGYDGETLAFVEVRTRTVRDDSRALPELSVTATKQSVLLRTAQRFLLERRVADCPRRFDVLAIDNFPGRPPLVRLHKDAFSAPAH